MDELARVDAELARRGLAASRERAQRLITAGLVTCNGRPVAKPSLKVRQEDELRVLGADIPYVSRGGLKLEKALDAFGVDPAGRVCMDVGASTGGFTDVLLQRGARRVYAIDVGTAQLAPELTRDPRVVSMERTNARALTPGMFDVPPTLGVMDVSFISIRLILPTVLPILGPEGRMVTLVKPQFEAGRREIGKRGIVRVRAVHERVLNDLIRFVPTLGWQVAALEYSPVCGGDGNIEFLADLRPGVPSYPERDVPDLVRQAHVTLR